MHRRILAGLSAATAAIAIAIPVAAAAPASAATPGETFGQYQQACFNEGGTRTSTSGGFTIPAEYLAEGDADKCVAYLQDLLDTKGWSFNGGFPYQLAIDGVFGQQTENAVLSFQAGEGLQRDGIVGPFTWTDLGSFRD